MDEILTSGKILLILSKTGSLIRTRRSKEIETNNNINDIIGRFAFLSAIFHH